MADIDDLIRQASSSESLRLNARICEALMLSYYDFVFHLANAFLGDSDEADDAAQETFLQAALHIDQYECGTSLKSWVAKIAVNTCRGRYRRQKVRQKLESVLKVITLQTLPSSDPSPEESAMLNERQRVLKQAVDALDEKHRLPVLLRYVHGLSVPEIAQILDEKEGTIHSRLHYAHQKLRGRLGGLVENGSDTKAGEA